MNNGYPQSKAKGTICYLLVLAKFLTVFMPLVFHRDLPVYTDFFSGLFSVKSKFVLK